MRLFHANLFTCVNNAALNVIELSKFLHSGAVAFGNAFKAVTVANGYVLCRVLLFALALRTFAIL